METLVTKKVSVVLHFIMADLDTGTRIKKKAHELFLQYGLRSVSMDDIANGIGISKKTIYQFYADKDELVDAVVESEFSKNENLCECDRMNAVNAIHEIFLAMDMLADMFRSMNPSFIFDMQKYHPKAYLKFDQYKNDSLFNIVRTNILRGIKEELFREDIDVDIIARFRVQSLMMAFSHEFNSTLKRSIPEIAKELIIHYLFGLVSIKGYKISIKYQQERINKK